MVFDCEIGKSCPSSPCFSLKMIANTRVCSSEASDRDCRIRMSVFVQEEFLKRDHVCVEYPVHIARRLENLDTTSALECPSKNRNGR